MNSLLSKKILFCGSSELSCGVLEFLETKNIYPHTVITQPDKPVGREKILTATVLSKLIDSLNIDGKSKNRKEINILKPEKIDSDFIEILKKENFDLCLVASYGKILKQEFLDIFPENVWNIHPSELPLFRGATPLQTQIVNGLKEIVVIVIKMDKLMDHGDILGAQKMQFDWEQKGIQTLEWEAGFLGGEIFFENFPSQKLTPQDHSKASFTTILYKEDGNVTREFEALNMEQIWRKYNAYNPWPGIFFKHNNLRIKITLMRKDLATGNIVIEKVLPESKKEISFTDFQNSY